MGGPLPKERKAQVQHNAPRASLPFLSELLSVTDVDLAVIWPSAPNAQSYAHVHIAKVLLRSTHVLEGIGRAWKSAFLFSSA